MNHLTIGAVVAVVGIAALVSYRYAEPLLEEYSQKTTSDASKTVGTVVLAVDDWVGYFPLCSPEMKKRMRSRGYGIKCENDQANYPERMKKLKEGKIDFAVATVDSYLLSGAPLNFPGSIVAVIDESKGGDAIVARKDFASNIDDLKKQQGFKVAFTPGSPSEHLLRAVGAHFDVPLFREAIGSWRVETSGSEAALKKLLNGDVPVAVLWEPNVSRAIADPKFVKILGTENTDKLIVDILIANREYLKDQRAAVDLFLANMFRTLKYYRDNPDILAQHIMEETKLNKREVETMLKGVAWASLYENAIKWFGVSGGSGVGGEAVVATIEGTLLILTANKNFANNPLPGGDPYRIMYSDPIAALHKQGITDQFGVSAQLSVGAQAAEPQNSLEKRFAELTPEGWGRLKQVGTLQSRPITFQSGSSALTYDGQLEIEKSAASLSHYPHFRILIEGHTGKSGDPEMNMQLSQSRAEAVAQYLQVTFNIDPNRMRAVGKGSSTPLPRVAGESERQYGYRLPRVAMRLMAEEF